ncbi:MAG: NAD(P)-dependent oxidoreductase [Acetobacter sp.]
MKILVAGASGVLGRALIGRLRHAGHDVWGMAHHARSLKVLDMLGAHPVQCNAMDRAAVFASFEHIRPDGVIDQLTSLPASPFDLPARLPADRILRLEGGGNLFEAAQVFQVGRYVQQSCGFYLDGGGALATEISPLRTGAPGTIGESARMYTALEKRVLSSPMLKGVALRYGFFYGPGTWYWPDGAFSDHVRQGDVALLGGGCSTLSFIHVDDAAQATVAALTAPCGIYNIVDNQPMTMHEWLPAYAQWVEAPAPRRIGADDAARLMGEESVYYQNSLTGACNRKAVAMLGLHPRGQPWQGG